MEHLSITLHGRRLELFLAVRRHWLSSRRLPIARLKRVDPLTDSAALDARVTAAHAHAHVLLPALRLKHVDPLADGATLDARVATAHVALVPKTVPIVPETVHVVVSETVPVVHDWALVAPETVPVVHGWVPVIPETVPVVHDWALVAPETVPVVPETIPVVPETIIVLGLALYWLFGRAGLGLAAGTLDRLQIAKSILETARQSGTSVHQIIARIQHIGSSIQCTSSSLANSS